MDAVTLHAVAAFAAGLVITLFLAAYLTPRGWWRRPNARALFIMIAGAWGFGSLILDATHAPAAASAPPPPVAVAPATPSAGLSYRVHRDLNLRAAPGVHAARVAIVPEGAMVTATGEQQGDWWQIQASIGGRTSTGWASSLWLRRSGE